MVANISEQFRIEVIGRHVEIPSGLQSYIIASLEQFGEKYAPRPAQGRVIFTPEGEGFRCECTLHLDSGQSLQSSGEALDVSASASSMLARIEKRLRRYRRKLKDHGNGAEMPSLFTEEPAAEPLAPDGADTAHWPDGHGDPAIIADAQGHLGSYTVAQAALKLEFEELQVLLFRNPAHNAINLVYQRRDGNIGWIDLSQVKL